MAQRTMLGNASNGAPTVGAALSGAATGVVLTYTVPAGKQAMLRFVSVANFTLAPTVQIRATVGGVTVVLWSGTTQVQLTAQMALNAADTVTINVSALIAASSFDAAIGAEEYSAI